MGRSGKLKNRQKITVSLSHDVYFALQRLSSASGVPCSRLMDDFLNPEVLNSISEGLEMARAGQDIKSISSRMSAVVSRHIVAASDSLKEFQGMGEK